MASYGGESIVLDVNDGDESPMIPLSSNANIGKGFRPQAQIVSPSRRPGSAAGSKVSFSNGSRLTSQLEDINGENEDDSDNLTIGAVDIPEPGGSSVSATVERYKTFVQAALCPEGVFVATLDESGQVTVWDWDKSERTTRHPQNVGTVSWNVGTKVGGLPMHFISVSKNAQYVIVCRIGQEPMDWRYQLFTGRGGTIPHSNEVKDRIAAFYDDGRRMAVVDAAKNVVESCVAGEWKYRMHGGWVRPPHLNKFSSLRILMTMLQKGCLLSTQSHDFGTGSLYFLPSGTTTNRNMSLEHITWENPCCDVTYDGLVFVSCDGNRAKSFDVETGIPLATREIGPVMKMQFLRDGRLATFAGGKLILYDPHSLSKLYEHEFKQVDDFFFSDSGWLVDANYTKNPLVMPLMHWMMQNPPKVDSESENFLRIDDSTDTRVRITLDEKESRALADELDSWQGKLDVDDEREVTVTPRSITLAENNNFQWIWIVPYELFDDHLRIGYIQSVTINPTSKPPVLYIDLIDHNEQRKQIILDIPMTGSDEFSDTKILLDGIRFLHLVSFMEESVRDWYKEYPDVEDAMNMVRRLTRKYPGRNFLSRVDSSILPLADLLRLGQDRYLDRILESDHNNPFAAVFDIQHRSVISLMITSDRWSPNVTKLVEHILKNATEHEAGHMATLLASLDDLSSIYPDFFSRILKQTFLHPSGAGPKDPLSLHERFHPIIDSSTATKEYEVNREPSRNFLAESGMRKVAICVVPLPNILEYINRRSESANMASARGWRRFIRTPHTQSLLTSAALTRSLFDEPNCLFPIILYRWNIFARRLFLIRCACYATLLALVISMIVSGSIIVAAIVSLFSLIFFFTEFSKVWRRGIILPYDYIDVAASLSSLVTSIMHVALGSRSPISLDALTILLMWTHLIQQSRIFPTSGIVISTIIEIIRRARTLLTLFIFFAVAFAHSVIIMTDTAQKQMELDANMPMFIFLATLAGITALVLLNAFMAMTAGTYSEIADTGERVWFRMMAQLVGEIEEQWGDRLGLYQKKMPRYLYYEAPLDFYTTWHDRNRKTAQPEPSEKQTAKPETTPAPNPQLELKKLIKVESDIEKLQEMLSKLLEKEEAEKKTASDAPKPVAFAANPISFPPPSDRPTIIKPMSVVGGLGPNIFNGNIGNISNARRTQSVVGFGHR